MLQSVRGGVRGCAAFLVLCTASVANNVTENYSCSDDPHKFPFNEQVGSRN
jgi:hypothetical protein